MNAMLKKEKLFILGIACYTALMLAVVALSPQWPSAKSLPMTLPNCHGTPQVRPSTIVLACADDGDSIEGIQWNRWGRTIATGVGVYSCCSYATFKGPMESYPAVVILNGLQRCPNHQLAYRFVSFIRIRDSLPKVARGFTIRYSCHPRL